MLKLKLFVQGMATPIAFATPVAALAFSGKSWADKNLMIGESSPRKAAISGCVGGGVSALLACPSERVKVILQNNPKVKSKCRFRQSNIKTINSDPVHAFRQIWSSGGLAAVQKGLTFTMIRDVSGYAAYFTTIFYCQRYFEQIDLSPIVGSFIAGAIVRVFIHFFVIKKPNIHDLKKADENSN